MDEAELRRQIVAIQTDVALSEAEKAQKRQALLSRRWQPADDLAEAPKGISSALQSQASNELALGGVTAGRQRVTSKGILEYVSLRRIASRLQRRQ